MSIGYYGKKQDDKFSYCSAVKPGETGTFLVIEYTQLRIKPPHLWVFGKGVSGDFSNFNDRDWSYSQGDKELMAVRFCIEKYETEYNGKKREYNPTMPELALLKLIQSDTGLTDGSMMFTATINLGQSAVRPANKILESDSIADLEIECTNIFYIENIAPFDGNIAGYSVADIDAFIESKTKNKAGFNGKAKYKTFEERLTEGAKVLDCDPSFESLYNKVKKLDSDVLIALIELLRLM
ncbi:hypothetical protein L1F28_24685 [Arthrospira platensis NCB002]|uniref:hypothetical protein n=2 Tax=Limnospira platensis TaxID=118562 RepID=UPI0001D0E5FF|nr:hypothetical protein [Arthrospira platensis NCB002]MDF2211867.1 hypothetical protein [Arthrospira platensis NCB002]BAI88076.1 hypothetical protein NIES39_A02370 [Arthrospira platensis NIES-39]BDT10499.1 hypothetical protein N39L_02220 [Arthrospira platensis NIES-39]